MCLCIMWVQYAGAAEGSVVSVAFCVTGHVSVLWDMCSDSLLVEPADGKVAAITLSLGRDPGAPDWTPAARQEGVLGPKLWQVTAILNI